MTSKLKSQIELILLLFLLERRYDILEYDSDISRKLYFILILDGDPYITITGTHHNLEKSVDININRSKTKDIIKDLEDGVLNEEQLYISHGRDPFGLNDLRENLLEEMITKIKGELRSLSL